MPRVKSTYTKQIGLRDLDKFRQECGQFYNEVVIKGTVTVIRDTAIIVLKHLIKRSPVYSGSYVLSHNIGNKFFNTVYTVRKPPISPTTGQSTRANASKMKHIAISRISKKLRAIKIRFGDVIQVSNSIPYVKDVEYGCAFYSGRQVYTQAYYNALEELGEIVTMTARMTWRAWEAYIKMKHMRILSDMPSLSQALKDLEADPAYIKWSQQDVLKGIPSDW